jgi:hypothetical protein
MINGFQPVGMMPGKGEIRKIGFEKLNPIFLIWADGSIRFTFSIHSHHL